MARYVLANRRAGMFTQGEKQASREALGSLLGSIQEIGRIHRDHAPDDPGARRLVVFDAHPDDVRRLPPIHRDVLFEREVLFDYDASPSTQRTPSTRKRAAGSQRRMRVQVRGRGRAVEGATTVLILSGKHGFEQQQSVTAASGNATLEFDRKLTPVGLAVVPPATFCPMVVRGPTGSTLRVDVPPLPTDGPNSWWHQALGVRRNSASRGRGIRVGVADTGVGPHPCLSHVDDIGSFSKNQHDPKGGADCADHGTHVCGIIGARPRKRGQYAGVAPGVTLLSARIFSEDASPNQAEVAHGIDALSKEHRADLINLSIGSTEPSKILHDSIVDALERGSLCVCAAGNSDASPAPVKWPAAYPETVGVSDIGLIGWGPPGSMAEFRIPPDAERHGDDGYFLSSNSCCGEGVDCGGPGVGIISTVPERFGLRAPFGSMTGTSMASPAVCGALAALLARDAAYTELPRDGKRSAHARKLLERACRDIGLARQFQGAGLPSLG